MERLISLREFIVEPKYWKDTEHFDNHDVLSLIISYANFLSQPLTISMFVPCDEEGNVLSEPDIENFDNGVGVEYDNFEHYKNRYNAEKEKVLFDVQNIPDDSFNFIYYFDLPDTDNECFCFDTSTKNWAIEGSEIYSATIENLVKYGLQLTPTAQKQIFG